MSAWSPMQPSVVEACCALFSDGTAFLQSKQAFLSCHNLPDCAWRGESHPLRGWLELSDRPSVEVRFTDWDTCGAEGSPGGRKLRVGVVVLATGAVTVTRKARLP